MELCADDVARLAAQVRSLLADELWASAAIAAGLLLTLRTDAETLALFADALSGKREWKRAQAHYRMARQRNARSDGKTDASLRFREAKCCNELDERSGAIAALQGIVGEFRSAKTNAFLGQLYNETGQRQYAIDAYKAALRENPMCLEVIEPLVELGATVDDVRAASARQSMEIDSDTAAAQSAAAPWYDAFVVAHGAFARHEYARAALEWRRVDDAFPANNHGLLRLSCCLVELDEAVEAASGYAAVRAADAHCVDLMDRFALALKKRHGAAAQHTLNALAHSLIATDAKRPETWLVVALHAEVSPGEGQLEKAIAFVDRAIELDAAHALAPRLKGDLLLSLGKPEAAREAFADANARRKDLSSFGGLVDCHLASRRFREALGAAKQAVEMVPNNARAIALVGKVLATSDDKTDMAKRAFTKALAIDAGCTDAAAALVELLERQRDYAECIKVLRAALHGLKSDALHTKLADIYSLDSQFAEALRCYHVALAHDPASERALRGMEQLEKRMRGEAPDDGDGGGI
ncbi:hypothetical protein M885DRAFT_508134 [Pelagophyceae sp. CCMP2097]|nr:hypothetical protein M885DRAFT_508134 [Pelagophyceae sp. CCMP2097]